MFNKIDRKNYSTRLITISRRWLELVAAVHILGGLSLCFDWPTFIWAEYRLQLYQVFSIANQADNNINQLVEMTTQLFGPTIASWGILMFHLVRRVKDREAIDILILATLLWFVLDSAISLKFGMIIHLVINSLAVLSIILPLVYLRFAGQKRSVKDYAVN